MTYRHPGLLIKTVTTLDVLSGGRAWLGIGAAWDEEEHRGLGVPYPGTAERFERLEETLLSRVNLAQESIEQVVDRFGKLSAIGTDHIIIGLAGVHEEGAFEKVPDLVAQVNALS